MVYAVRIHTEGDYGTTTTQVVSLHSSPEGARKALVKALEAVATERYQGGYRPCVVWDSPAKKLAEVKELDSFNLVRGVTSWSGDVWAMHVRP
jgi:hypothetical protein